MQEADQDLYRFYERYVNALHERDVPTILEMSIDDPEGSFWGIGTAPNMQMTLSQLAKIGSKLPPVETTHEDVVGFVEGDVAWFRGVFTAELPGDPVKEIARGTAVFRRVKGEWKVVQFHKSQPVPLRWIPGEVIDSAKRS